MAAQFMKRLHPIALLLLLTLSFISISSPALAQDPPGTALITGCKAGSMVGAYKKPGLAVRAYARFSCGSSVFVWNATSKMALVQQGMTVAFVPAKYIFDPGTSKGTSPAAVRTFLQAMAEGSSSADGSAISVRRELVRSCLAMRGCRAETWSHLAWTRIESANDSTEQSDATLRLFAGGVYYNALVVSPPVRFKDHPLPSLASPVLVLEGPGLSVAVGGHSCYALGSNGKWSAAGASAGQAAAAIR
jgi:hypothetical protein